MRWQTIGFGILIITGILLIITGFLYITIGGDAGVILLLIPGFGFLIAGIIGLFMEKKKR